MNWATIIALYFIIDFVLTLLVVGTRLHISTGSVVLIFITHALFVWKLIEHLGAFS